MSKLKILGKIQAAYDQSWLAQAFRDIEHQVNGMSEGRITAAYTALTAPPTTGTWTRGDEIRNSQPSELGSVSSKYVIRGWICTAGGTPGTWLEQRVLTGN